MIEHPKEPEYIEPLARSIVSHDCELRPQHEGVEVTYKGVSGWLLRYRVSCEHNLLAITKTESDKILADLNAASNTDI
jgi:hypothetical protein